MRNWRATKLAGIATLLIFGVNAGPPPKRANLEVGVGGGYSQPPGGCASTESLTRIRSSAKFSYRGEAGASASVELGGSRFDERKGGSEIKTGEVYVAPTAGWHGEKFGADLGLVVAVGLHSEARTILAVDGREIIPTGRLWLGRKHFHFFASFVEPSSTVSTLVNLSMGLGHKSDSYRIGGGFGYVAGASEYFRIFMRGQRRVSRTLWLGGGLELQPYDGIYAAGTLGFDF